MSHIEWRCSWRRRGWSSTTRTKTRTFSRRDDLERFLAKLEGDGRPDLSSIEFVKVDSRTVTAWRPVT